MGRNGANEMTEIFPPEQQPAMEWVDPRLLMPHPRQASIYGEDEVADLVEAIRISHTIKPLVVTSHNVLLSGHRRRQAALLLEWPLVPVERHSCVDETEEVELLLRENQYRDKTAAQRVREAEAWREIETRKAACRQHAALKQGQVLPVRTLAPTQQTGRVRAVLAERAGFGSERTYEKAAHVVKLADQFAEQGETARSQALLTVLNEQSVDAAARVLKLPEPEQRAVLDRLVAGEARTVQAAVLEIKKAQIASQAQAAPSKPQVTLASWHEWLPGLPPCDLLLTDPPYQTDVEDIGAFAHTWLPPALAKVKATGHAFVCIGSYPDELDAYLHQHATGALPLPLAEVLTWVYHNTLGPQPSRTYKRNWQAILHFAGPHATLLDCPLLTEQFAAMEINAPDGRQGERFHTWQKPDELAERLIRHASRVGATVYDPFCGTGTFVLAAHRLGRIASGCDTSPEMLALAEQRGCVVDAGKRRTPEGGE